MLKRTPLFEAHQQLGGRLIEFGGWEMPVQYSGIVDEHLTVRNAAGVFDISHMGEFFVHGVGALEFLNAVLTNDLRKIEPGQAQYTLMCNERGGVVDDLYAYCLAPGNYLLIVNASRIDADFEWLQLQREKFPHDDEVSLDNRSDVYGAVAVQGPSVAGWIDRCFDGQSGALSGLSKNQIRKVPFLGDAIHVARTGYTGEDGFEVVAPANLIEKVWWRSLEAGKEAGIKPAGLGARDTLRTEMCYPLYGHELDENTTPIEAGLGFFVALDKGEFNGRETIFRQKQNGPSRRLVAFQMTGKSAPPRPDYPVRSPGGGVIGKVTSGTQSPSLGTGIGLAYVTPEFAKTGTALDIEIRGRPAPAVVVSKPIYRKQKSTN